MMTATPAEWTLEEYRQVYSDFYKEANGFRPRHDTSEWTLEKWVEVWKELGETCEYNRKQQERSEAAAIKEFEETLAKLIAQGAKDRATAIRCMHDAEHVGSDSEYLCYKLGLPYGYFRK